MYPAQIDLGQNFFSSFVKGVVERKVLQRGFLSNLICVSSPHPGPVTLKQRGKAQMFLRRRRKPSGKFIIPCAHHSFLVSTFWLKMLNDVVPVDLLASKRLELVPFILLLTSQYQKQTWLRRILSYIRFRISSGLLAEHVTSKY